MLSHRLLRLSAIALMGGTAVWALAPQAARPGSATALVNAPLISVRSPIDGRIAAASPEAARVVAPGETLVRIEADRQDPGQLAVLKADERACAAELAAKDRQYREFSDLRAVFGQRERDYHAALGGWLDARAAELEAGLAAAVTTRDETAARIARSRDLAGQGALAKAGLEHDEADRARAEAEVSASAARLAAVRREREALDTGIIVQGEASYSRQRFDEMTLRLVDLGAERDQLVADHDAAVEKIAGAEREMSGKAAFAPRATAPGVIWRASGAPGAPVRAGDEVLQLLDCERRFIEVAVPERRFEAIRSGAAAWVRLRGSAALAGARVAAVRGSGGRFADPQLAADTPAVADGQLSVIVALDPPAAAPILAGGRENADRGSAAFCDVGRTAEVRFDRGLAADAVEIVAGFAQRLAAVVRPGTAETAAR